MNNQLRFKTVVEAFGAAKEVKVKGLEKIYTQRFSTPAYIYAQSNASAQIFAQLPRFILEAITFGGVLLMILYFMKQSGSFNLVLPILSLYVFAGYRLMPALQKIYSSFTQLTFVGPSLEKLYEDIKNLQSFDTNITQDKLLFNKSITLKNIHYNYPNSSRTVLKNINFEIPIKSTIGLVGATGCGKTTTVDIILGLLEAQKGNLKLFKKITKKYKERQRNIGYTQHIYR